MRTFAKEGKTESRPALQNKQNEEDPTMRKKLLTLFLAVTMALSLLPPPTPALAAVLDPERHRQLL